jgi:hypothetical protein
MNMLYAWIHTTFFNSRFSSCQYTLSSTPNPTVGQLGLGRYTVCRIDTNHDICFTIQYVSRYMNWFWHSIFSVQNSCLLGFLMMSTYYPHAPLPPFSNTSLGLNLQKTERSDWLYIKFIWEVIFRITLRGIVFFPDRYFTKRIDTRIVLTKDRFYRYFDILSQPYGQSRYSSSICVLRWRNVTNQQPSANVVVNKRHPHVTLRVSAFCADVM